MYEKILLKLKEQRGSTSNVSDRSLEDLARSLESIISTDELLTKTDLSKAIESIDGNINFYTAKQVEAAKAKAIEEQKKVVEDLAKKEAEKKLAEEQKSGEQPDIAKLISDALNPIVTELNGLKTQKVAQTRSEILNEKLKETPEIFRNATLKGFSRMNFETDEDFNTYIKEIETDSKVAVQIGLEKGLNTYTPKGDIKKPNPEAVSPEMAEAIKELTAVKEEDKKF